MDGVVMRRPGVPSTFGPRPHLPAVCDRVSGLAYVGYGHGSHARGRRKPDILPLHRGLDGIVGAFDRKIPFQHQAQADQVPGHGLNGLR